MRGCLRTGDGRTYGCRDKGTLGMTDTSPSLSRDDSGEVPHCAIGSVCWMGRSVFRTSTSNLSTVLRI